jgi:transposase
METITMSGKEAPRPGILRAASAGAITNRQAAEALRLTIRHVQRLKVRFRADGLRGLVHRGRGQPSPRRLADPVRAQIERLMLTGYDRVNDVHLTEKLREVHGLAVSRPTVRRIRLALGRPARRPRRAPHHRRRRPREAAPGSLIQIDGSEFAWLEQRGPAASLLGAIDDATGAILALHLRPAEDLHGYLTLFAELFAAHGLPLAVYGDRLGVFVRNDPHWSLEEELQGHQHPTHFGRLLQTLGIAYIAAHSPQAKGRVERLWGTLQDRLVTELRLLGITTLEAANAFLPTFIADYNRRFAVPAAAPALWRRPPLHHDRLLGCRYRRVVARDHTVRLGERLVQLPPRPRHRSYAGSRVEVRELVDGRLLVLADDHVLATQPPPPGPFVLTPRRQQRGRDYSYRPALAPRLSPSPPTPPRARRPTRPAATHPWRLDAARDLAIKTLRATTRARGDDRSTEQLGRHFH